MLRSGTAATLRTGSNTRASSISVGGKTPYGNFDDFRGRIATVFQQDRLMPWRSALDNARLPLGNLLTVEMRYLLEKVHVPWSKRCASVRSLT